MTHTRAPRRVPVSSRRAPRARSHGRRLAWTLAAAVAGIAPYARGDVTLGPVVSPRGEGRVTVAWASSHPPGAPETLTVLAPGGARRVVSATQAAGTVRRVELTGLVPGTLYSYEVEDRRGRFVAPPAARDEVRLAVFGDARSGHLVHRHLVDALSALSPDACLATGDLVSAGNSLAQWRHFYAIERPLLERAPFLSARGNHDGAASLFERLVVPVLASNPAGARTWDAVDIGPVHVVMVDTNQPHGPSSPQYAFVRDDLAAHTSQPTIVLLHRPVYSSGYYGNGVALQHTLAPLFERYGVDLVMQGHDHHYQRSLPIHGVTYVVTGGGGAPLRAVRGAPWSAVQESTHHYVVIDASSHRLRVVARRLDGSALDAFELDPHANDPTTTTTTTTAPPAAAPRVTQRAARPAPPWGLPAWTVAGAFSLALGVSTAAASRRRRPAPRASKPKPPSPA